MASELRRTVHPRKGCRLHHPRKGRRQRRPRNPIAGDPAPPVPADPPGTAHPLPAHPTSPAPADPGAASRASAMAAVPVASRAFSAAAYAPRAPAPLASVLLHRGARGLHARPPHLLLSRQMDAGLAPHAETRGWRRPPARGGRARPHGMADRRHCCEAWVRRGRHCVRRNASPDGRLVFGEV